MRQIIVWTVMWSGILLFIGCGGGVDNTSSNKENNTDRKQVQLKLQFPIDTKRSSKGIQKRTNEQQKLNDEIQWVELDIAHQDENGETIYDLQGEPLEKTAHGWGTGFALDFRNAPFTFTARAYNLLEEILYRGTTTLKDPIGTPTVSMNMRPTVNPFPTRALPLLQDVNITDINSSSKNIKFTIYDLNDEKLNYAITVQSGTVTPNHGIIQVPQIFSPIHTNIFDVNYTNFTGDVLRGKIALTNPFGDVVEYNFDDINGQFFINTPPIVSNVKMQVNKSRVTVTGTLTDKEHDAISYEWNVIHSHAQIQNGKSGTGNSTTLELIKYNPDDALVVEINATDARGASSYESYALTPLAFYPSKIFKTGQTKSYDDNGHLVTNGSFKDDGYYKVGAKRNLVHVKNRVIDYDLNLIWQDLPKHYVAKDKSTQYYRATTLSQAKGICNLFGERLPTIQELVSITDKSRTAPAFNKAFKNVALFNNGVLKYYVYWSSTPVGNPNDNLSWGVSSGDGHTQDIGHGAVHMVRCVKDGIN